MSDSISTLLIRNLDEVFGENDPKRRRAAVGEIFTEDCVFYDPSRGVYRRLVGNRSARSEGTAGFCQELRFLCS
jgi:hypothetical protein